MVIFRFMVAATRRLRVFFEFLLIFFARPKGLAATEKTNLQRT
jgi:hypothetical protein